MTATTLWEYWGLESPEQMAEHLRQSEERRQRMQKVLEDLARSTGRSYDEWLRKPEGVKA